MRTKGDISIELQLYSYGRGGKETISQANEIDIQVEARLPDSPKTEPIKAIELFQFQRGETQDIQYNG